MFRTLFLLASFCLGPVLPAEDRRPAVLPGVHEVKPPDEETTKAPCKTRRSVTDGTQAHEGSSKSSSKKRETVSPEPTAHP